MNPLITVRKYVITTGMSVGATRPVACGSVTMPLFPFGWSNAVHAAAREEFPTKSVQFQDPWDLRDSEPEMEQGKGDSAYSHTLLAAAHD